MVNTTLKSNKNKKKSAEQYARKLVRRHNMELELKDQIAKLLISNDENSISELLRTLGYNSHMSECYIRSFRKISNRETAPELSNFNLPSFHEEFNGGIFFCIHCNKLFSNVIQVQDHLGSDHKDLHYFCKKCGLLYATSRQLINHQSIFNYYCRHCDYATDHYRTYQTHCARLHDVSVPRMRDLLHNKPGR